MNERDRLIELYNESDNDCNNRDCDSCKYWGTPNCMMVKFIDKILANGVIVPTCKVGDKAYFLCRNRDTYEWYICEKEICSIEVYENGIDYYVSRICSFVEMEIGVRLFLIPEEAEKALKERSEDDENK